MRRRLQVLLALLGLVLAVTVVSGGDGATAATITQSAGCFSPVSSSWSTLPLSVSATPAPTSVNAGDTITVSGTVLVVTVSSALIEAGVGAGVVNEGSNSVASTVNLKLSGSNTTQGTQTATGAANLAFTVDVDDVTGDVTVDPDPVVGSVALTNTTWTAPGGDVTFAVSAGTPPAGSVPTLVERNAAPIQILNKLNNSLNANFYCWAGAANTGGTALVSSAPNPIATVTVTGGEPPSSTTTSSTPPTTGSTTTTTVASTATTTPPPGPRTATGDYTATCSNSITPDLSTLTFHVTGTVPGQVTAGQPVTMSEQSWTIDVPGSVLDAGVALGLLNEGDTVDSLVTVGVFASNTAEGTRTAGPIALTLGPIELDPNTGQADDVSVTFSVPDMTWTSVGGTVSYSMASASVAVTLGAIEVAFECAPEAPVAAFVTTNVIGESVIPAATTTIMGAGTNTTTPTTTQAQGQLPTTGGVPIGLVVLGALLVGIGFLLASAARPARRRHGALP